MTTQNNNTQRMMDALNRARGDIASLADWIELELEKQNDDDVTWASVNELEGVRDELVKTLAFFAGIDPTEINRSLDELHM